MPLSATVSQMLRGGCAIPAHPLALNRNRKLDERRQRALSRYYIDAGVGGIAVAVHTTQFAIRRGEIGLLRPVLELAREEMDRGDAARSVPLLRIGGICGETPQAVAEARQLGDLRYHAGLLSLAALSGADDARLLDHCRAVAEVLPIVGFYLQPAVGGRVLSYAFWREFCEIAQVVAIKIAPFNRYQTLEVIRAVAESGRDDIALYTGNDDSIVVDLLTDFAVSTSSGLIHRRIVGGLLGHWSVWTSRAVALQQACSAHTDGKAILDHPPLTIAAQVLDCNAAFFDAANGFRGCIAGLHEVLRRQGLLEGIWCLDPQEDLSSGQRQEIDRVYAAYPHLNDDAFVIEHRDRWLSR